MDMSTQLAFVDTESFTATATQRRPPTGSTRVAGRRSPNSNRNAAQVRKTRASQSARLRSGSTSSSQAFRQSAQWRIDEGTRRAGRAGIASARQALADARSAAFTDQVVDAA